MVEATQAPRQKAHPGTRPVSQVPVRPCALPVVLGYTTFRADIGVVCLHWFIWKIVSLQQGHPAPPPGAKPGQTAEVWWPCWIFAFGILCNCLLDPSSAPVDVLKLGPCGGVVVPRQALHWLPRAPSVGSTWVTEHLPPSSYIVGCVCIWMKIQFLPWSVSAYLYHCAQGPFKVHYLYAHFGLLWNCLPPRVSSWSKNVRKR